MKLYILLTSVILIGSTAHAGKTEDCVQRVIAHINEIEDKNPNQDISKAEVRAILIKEDRNCQIAVVKVALQAGQAVARMTMGPGDDEIEPSRAEIIFTLNDFMNSTSETPALSLPPPSAATP